MSRNDRLVVDGLGRLPQFSHAGLTDDLIFVSGTLGSGEGLALVSGGIGPETTQTLHNIERILSAAGATWDDVVKVSVFIALCRDRFVAPVWQRTERDLQIKPTLRLVPPIEEPLVQFQRRHAVLFVVALDSVEYAQVTGVQPSLELDH